MEATRLKTGAELRMKTLRGRGLFSGHLSLLVFFAFAVLMPCCLARTTWHSEPSCTPRQANILRTLQDSTRELQRAANVSMQFFTEGENARIPGPLVSRLNNRPAIIRVPATEQQDDGEIMAIHFRALSEAGIIFSRAKEIISAVRNLPCSPSDAEEVLRELDNVLDRTELTLSSLTEYLRSSGHARVMEASRLSQTTVLRRLNMLRDPTKCAFGPKQIYVLVRDLSRMCGQLLRQCSALYARKRCGV